MPIVDYHPPDYSTVPYVPFVPYTPYVQPWNPPTAGCPFCDPPRCPCCGNPLRAMWPIFHPTYPRWLSNSSNASYSARLPTTAHFTTLRSRFPTQGVSCHCGAP